jgi:alpha-tubulin suppressor-like RCC1 family protein
MLAALGLLAVPVSASAISYGVRAWGYNASGQLGNGTNAASNVPVEVSRLTGVAAVASGSFHSLAVLKNGHVMAWGGGGNGQLGNGTEANSNVPVEVKGLTEATAVAGGVEHSLAVLKNGHVMAWGQNGNGQLGNGTFTNSNVPVEVSGLTEATAVAGGFEESLALLKNGHVMAWGYNGNGQLGNGTEVASSNVPVEVKGLSDATAVAGGDQLSLALLKNGHVMAWGANGYGQLGNGTELVSNVPVEVKGLTEVTSIAGGGFHSLAALKNGRVMAWGYNKFGQLGNGTETNSNVPVEVKGLTEVAAVAGGFMHSLAMLKNGHVMAWGQNENGQLGNGTSTNSDVPVEVVGLTGVTAVAGGEGHSLALTAQQPHYYSNQVPVGSEPVNLISWGTLTLRTVAGGSGEVTCHSAEAGTVANPAGAGAGVGSTQVLATFDCESTTCPYTSVVTAESLPWPSVLEYEGSVIRVKTTGVKLKIDCQKEGKSEGSETFVGADQPSFHRGTSALHPGFLEYDPGAGSLEKEGSKGAVLAKIEGEVKVLGYDEQELINAM